MSQILHTLLKHSVLHDVTASESPQAHTCRVVKVQSFSKLSTLSLCKQHREPVISANLPAQLPPCSHSQPVLWARLPKAWSLFLVDPRMDFMYGGKAGIIPVGTRHRTRVAAAQTGCILACAVDPSQILLGPEPPGSSTGWQSYPSPQELFLSAALLEK